MINTKAHDRVRGEALFIVGDDFDRVYTLIYRSAINTSLPNAVTKESELESILCEI